jgi:protein-S-isoprenylcysteine O-methyltransferase Ste14
MTQMLTAPMNPPSERAPQHSAKKMIQMLASPALWIALLLAGAGRLDWVRGWICIALYMAGMTTILFTTRHYNPALVEAREKWRHKETRRFDKVFFLAFLPLVFLQPVLAGMDVVRFRWSSMPVYFAYVGAPLFVLAVAVIAWSMAINPFAEVTVRIQTDRGHRVITSGPYRLVRHPLYVGTILMYVATPLVLGSKWALTITALMALLFIVRTLLEDQTLRRELSGYEDYAAHTRYRLLPGLW